MVILFRDSRGQRVIIELDEHVFYNQHIEIRLKPFSKHFYIKTVSPNLEQTKPLMRKLKPSDAELVDWGCTRRS